MPSCSSSIPGLCVSFCILLLSLVHPSIYCVCSRGRYCTWLWGHREQQKWRGSLFSWDLGAGGRDAVCDSTNRSSRHGLKASTLAVTGQRPLTLDACHHDLEYCNPLIFPLSSISMSVPVSSCLNRGSCISLSSYPFPVLSPSSTPSSVFSVTLLRAATYSGPMR